MEIKPPIKQQISMLLVIDKSYLLQFCVNDSQTLWLALKGCCTSISVYQLAFGVGSVRDSIVQFITKAACGDCNKGQRSKLRFQLKSKLNLALWLQNYLKP